MADDLAQHAQYADSTADELRRKYRQERDKRLHPDGNEQYIEVSGQYSGFSDHDPFTSAPAERPCRAECVDVVVIGGGFCGMLAAARLMDSGVKDVLIVEAGGDFGGTWYWNRYPGSQCDIESYCYLPLLEELGYIPQQKYADATEIFDHCRRIAESYGLYEHGLLNTRVKKLQWMESEARWCVSTDRGDELRARFVIQAIGTASRPKLPNIPGLLSFAGSIFHTSRWDYACTGGGPRETRLDRLADKRVAIIGTGASGVQCIPHLAEHARHLYVFQRTPSSVDARRNKPTDPVWANSLAPGWQRERQENFADIVMGRPVSCDMVDDGWTEMFRRVRSRVAAGMSAGKRIDPVEAARLAELADFEKMDELRSRVDDIVGNSATAELLKPWYRYFCKRPTFNDEYLQSFNRDNVSLVDVSGTRGVERIDSEGVLTGGRKYPVECIVLATGFEITSSPRRRIHFEVIGRNGKSLFDHWESGLKTLHGVSSHGFPNWFFMGISQNGFSVNMTSMFDDQARHIAYIVSSLFERDVATAEVTTEAETEWVAEIRRLSVLRTEFLQECTPGYYNNEGAGAASGGIAHEIYAPGINAFNALLAEWRRDGELKGFETTRQRACIS